MVRETSVHSVIGALRSAVAVHGKERLGEDVASVVMVGARVYDTSVVHYGERQGVRLIETYTTHVSAVAVADEKVADLGWGVAGGDGGPGGGETIYCRREDSGLHSQHIRLMRLSS